MADTTTVSSKDIYKDAENLYGHKITPKEMPGTEIGIDTDNEFYDSIVSDGDSSVVDINRINAFTQVTNSRETLYDVLDTMAQDSLIAAVLETYAEDATETNEQGEIVWCEASDPKVGKYINFLLSSLNVDKHIYSWVYSLCKYGDVYLKLFRESDFSDSLLDDKEHTALNEKFSEVQNTSAVLDENVNIKYYKHNDRLVNYIEMVPNPAEMFELTKFGKSYAYIKTNSIPKVATEESSLINTYYLYRMRRNDVDVYNAVSFVHGCLTDDTPRFPEQIQIFNTYDMDKEDAYVYTVRRGQSILYNSYKIWRENMLLENALLLNRITKSALLRVVEVEVADMPKDKVRERLQRIKSLVEQKASINTNNMMSEYVNPGPMENTVYVPTKNGVGAINTQQIGGDVNIRDIADIDYFKNKLFAGLRVPKQYFSETDDSAGFNGGTSLSIISSRYAKTVKRIQATTIQMITDAINILLIDRGLDSYVNKFTLKMQPPVTQEELDKRDSLSSEIGVTDDVMRMLEGVEDPVIRLKILKSMLSNVISNQEVIGLIQDQIDRLENDLAEEKTNPDDSDMDSEFDSFDDLGLGDSGGDFGSDDLGDIFSSGGDDSFDDFDIGDTGGDTLPTPSEAGGGLDFTDEL